MVGLKGEELETFVNQLNHLPTLEEVFKAEKALTHLTTLTAQEKGRLVDKLNSWMLHGIKPMTKAMSKLLDDQNMLQRFTILDFLQRRVDKVWNSVKDAMGTSATIGGDAITTLIQNAAAARYSTKIAQLLTKIRSCKGGCTESDLRQFVKDALPDLKKIHLNVIPCRFADQLVHKSKLSPNDVVVRVDSDGRYVVREKQCFDQIYVKIPGSELDLRIHKIA